MSPTSNARLRLWSVVLSLLFAAACRGAPEAPGPEPRAEVVGAEAAATEAVQVQPAEPPPPPPPLQADLHLDTPTQLVERDVGMDHADLEASIARLREGGTNVAVQVLWPGRRGGPQRVEALLERIEAEIARHDDLVLARSPDEARAAVAEGRIAVVLALEGGHGLAEDWRAHLAELDARGLRMLGVTWSNSNRFAGSSGDGGGGLTEEGRALIAEARRLGMVVDVSHASRQATLEICGDSPAPVVASHSNAYAVRAHARNLTDEELRCIGATGGVVGLNFHAPFVGPGADVEKVADHAEHIAAMAGHEALALGSDYDGYIRVPQGLEDASRLSRLWEVLGARGLTPEQVEGARGENFMRAWEQAYRTRSVP